jgi:hypothetical protein
MSIIKIDCHCGRSEAKTRNPLIIVNSPVGARLCLVPFIPAGSACIE